MKKLTLILMIVSMMVACDQSNESQLLPFDNFRFSYRIGDHTANNPYYFTSQIQMRDDLLSDVSSNPVSPGYAPDECVINKELTDKVFSFTCDCTVPFENSTIDYKISMHADRETKEMTEALIIFPEYNVKYSFINNAYYLELTVQDDDLITMSTNYNPTIENRGNPVEISINYAWVLQ